MLNIKKSEEYELYRTVLKLNTNRNQLIPKGYGSRGVYSTIISRAYYSAYSFSLMWLIDKHNFKFRKPYEFDKYEKYITEHTQVSDALKEHKEYKCSDKLVEMKELRKDADYHLNIPITERQVESTIKNMEYIIKKFIPKF